ncbi:AhpC-TSA-domain-containing protein [Gloeophyllum trabeum ATCC 11539]|uniref:thioredoxin-dependent peroxiredoxin n=1 Tax=Gloeophyllum trabeum (strain ATCC 11539 / FP-39264 / Madison 617) TaxID=670483 RepID=S7PV11_GLOTA|nr:AhpC-TSA-domain-containing protein [Gloeophyllum trabeum ATCC 11539]EPQ51192.1 AhpC-TSA-domain-containing protein [Gloeophyllum trabeum ATCC 11539]
MPRKTNPAAEGSDSKIEQAPRRSTRLSTAQSVANDSTASNAKRTRDVDEADVGSAAGSKKAKSTDRSTKDAKGSEVTDDSAADSAISAIPPINIGDKLPSLILKNEQDEDVDVASLTTDRGVVLFLVPKADTPGCTNQACGFRDSYPDFTSAGFDVYCLSADKPVAQSKWKTKKHLPYALLSDPKRVLITALGAGEGGKTKRSHFVFLKGGQLADKKLPVKPVDSPKLAYEFVQTISKE